MMLNKHHAKRSLRTYQAVKSPLKLGLPNNRKHLDSIVLSLQKEIETVWRVSVNYHAFRFDGEHARRYRVMDNRIKAVLRGKGLIK